MTAQPRPLEISDVIARGGAAGPAEAASRLRERGQEHAARTVLRLPSNPDGAFDRERVDSALVAAHLELQRLADELSFGRLVAEQLNPTVARLRADGVRAVRVVDVGCGIGFVLRCLALGGWLGPDVELVGADLNSALVAEARDLARAEGLRVRFEVANALAPGGLCDRPAATIVISSGLLHHLAPDQLAPFFAAHEALGVAAFAHWDPQPSAWSTLGSWLFHRARVRTAIAMHDGVMSVRRAYPASRLLAAARLGAPSYAIECRDSPRLVPNALRVVRPLVGARAS